MKLQKLSLENIRSYAKEVVEFPEGSFLLSGDIGSGKSTILLAVEFSLFGIKRGQMSGASLLRHGTNSGSVELSLKIDGKEITIKRGLKRGKSGVSQEAGYIIINGVKEQLTPMELKSRVFEILGYPQELVGKADDLIYRYTVYTPQEEMKHILYENPDSRLNTLRKVFGIDKYKRIRENTNLFVRKIREKQRELKGITEDLDEKKKALDEITARFYVLQKGWEEIRPLSEKNREEVKKKREELQSYQGKMKELSELLTQKSVIEQRIQHGQNLLKEKREEISVFKQEIASLKEKAGSIKVLDFEKTPDMIQKEIESYETKMDDHKQRAQAAEQQMEFLKSKMAELEKELQEKAKVADASLTKREIEDLKLKISRKEELVQFMESAQTTLDDTRAQMIKFKTKKEGAENIMKDISSLETCPVCLQQVDERHKHDVSEKERESIKRMLAELTKLSAEEKALEEKIESVKKDIGKIEKDEKLLVSLITELKNSETVAAEVKNKTKILESHIENYKVLSMQIAQLKKTDISLLAKRVADLKSMLAKINENNILVAEKKNILERIAEKEKLRLAKGESVKAGDQKIEELATQLKVILRKIESLKEVENDMKSAEKVLKEEEEKTQKIEVKMKQIETEKEIVEKQHELLASEVKRKEGFRKENQRLDTLRNWFTEYFINVVGTIEKHVMYRVHNEFNDTFRTWFSHLIEEEIMTARLDDTFSPVIEQNGYDTELDSLSGGEKTAVALSYRLALNRVINDLIQEIKTKDIIILDEPTDGFSNEQLDKVGEVLSQLDTRQTVIVSHESKVEGFVENVIKISKEGHVSSIS